MRHLPRGFTLIEALAVIALVGTVSVTALPSLVDLHAQAEAATLASLAAAAGSAMVLNQAGCMVTQQQAVPGKCQPVRDCSDVGALLIGAVPAGYQVPAQPLQPGDGRCQLLRLHDGAGAAFHGAGTGD
jgi:MSHA pilin protein MshA